MSFLGIDIGTQSLKVVVVDDELRVLGSASSPYGLSYPRPGWVEQNPRDWEDALAVAVPKALAKAGLSGADLRAIGVAGQLDGCVAVDSEGEPISSCLIWMDRRASGELPPLPEDFRQRTGVVADAGHMAAKIAWLQSRVSADRYHQPVSYMVARLTGQSVFDPALASTTMLYDLETGAFAEDLCEAFSIDPRALPSIAPAHSRAGAVSKAAAERFGLRGGTVVAVGTGDDFATPLGAGRIDPGVLLCVLGTAEVVGAVTDELIIDDSGLLETHDYVAGRYLVENPGWLAGGAVAWVRALLGFDDDRELDAAAARVPPGSDGLLFLPALTGAMAPRWNAAARACFYGLTPAHGRGHMARAVLEGCAFAMRDVQLRLQELGHPPSCIAALGGGAASDVWLQIRADASALPVHGATAADSCAIGAALLALCAETDLAVVDAARRIRLVSRTFEPNAGALGAYTEAHRRYRALFDSLEPLF